MFFHTPGSVVTLPPENTTSSTNLISTLTMRILTVFSIFSETAPFPLIEKQLSAPIIPKIMLGSF